MRKLIEWLEENKTRVRKYVLIHILYLFILATIALFIMSFFIKIDAMLANIYYSLTSVLGGVYGFYTATKPSKDNNFEQNNKYSDLNN